MFECDNAIKNNVCEDSDRIFIGFFKFAKFLKENAKAKLKAPLKMMNDNRCACVVLRVYKNNHYKPPKTQNKCRYFKAYKCKSCFFCFII